MACSRGAAAAAKPNVCSSTVECSSLVTRHPLGPITPVHFHLNPLHLIPLFLPVLSLVPIPFWLPVRWSWMGSLVLNEHQGKEGWTWGCAGPAFGSSSTGPSLSLTNVTPSWGHVPDYVCSPKAWAWFSVSGWGQDPASRKQFPSYTTLIYHLFSSLSIDCKAEKQQCCPKETAGADRQLQELQAQPRFPWSSPRAPTPEVQITLQCQGPDWRLLFDSLGSKLRSDLLIFCLQWTFSLRYRAANTPDVEHIDWTSAGPFLEPQPLLQQGQETQQRMESSDWQNPQPESAACA